MTESYTGQEAAEFIMTEEMREELFGYLVNSHDTAIGSKQRPAVAEEVAAAEDLLNLDLESKDWATDKMFTFSESNYRPDVEMRKAIMEKLGMGEDYEIRRYDIVLNSGVNQRVYKVIGLGKWEEVEIPSARRDGSTFKTKSLFRVPNSTFFLGKTVFESEQAKYRNFDEGELGALERTIVYIKDKKGAEQVA